jgi:hypothetical protein
MQKILPLIKMKALIKNRKKTSEGFGKLKLQFVFKLGNGLTKTVSQLFFSSFLQNILFQK